jgi:hypothetical protein
MIRKLTLAASVAALTTLGSLAGPVAAAPIGPMTPAVGGFTQIEPVQYGVCRAWARECASRWGWGSWRFRRCMRNHGC